VTKVKARSDNVKLGVENRPIVDVTRPTTLSAAGKWIHQTNKQQPRLCFLADRTATQYDRLYKGVVQSQLSFVWPLL